MTDDLKQAAAGCLGITPEELEHLSITPAELARLVADVEASRGKVAALDLPPGYEPGSHELRLPDTHARAMGETRPQWIRQDKKVKPAFESPLERAVADEEKRVRAEACHSLRADAANDASKLAADKRKAKGDETVAKVETLAAEGKRPHVIAKRVGLNKKSGARRVNQILAAAKNKKSP